MDVRDAGGLRGFLQEIELLVVAVEKGVAAGHETLEDLRLGGGDLLDVA